MDVEIGDFRAVEQLDPGPGPALAQCYRGQDQRSGVAVAMTVLWNGQHDAAQEALEMLPEVQHPHLLPVDALVQDGTLLALICQWPAGGRLAELLARRHRLTAPETLTVLIPVASALAAAHAAGVRHGDVSPSAIWFDGAGRPLLGAVGVAHAVAAVGGGLPAGVGDVAPEVVRGERRPGGSVTTAADVFSLGSVALRCLAGRPDPRPADGEAVWFRQPPGCSEHRRSTRSQPLLPRPWPAHVSRTRFEAASHRLARSSTGLPRWVRPNRWGFGPLPATESPESVEWLGCHGSASKGCDGRVVR